MPHSCCCCQWTEARWEGALADQCQMACFSKLGLPPFFLLVSSNAGVFSGDEVEVEEEETPALAAAAVALRRHKGGDIAYRRRRHRPSRSRRCSPRPPTTVSLRGRAAATDRRPGSAAPRCRQPLYPHSSFSTWPTLLAEEVLILDGEIQRQRCRSAMAKSAPALLEVSALLLALLLAQTRGAAPGVAGEVPLASELGVAGGNDDVFGFSSGGRRRRRGCSSCWPGERPRGLPGRCHSLLN